MALQSKQSIDMPRWTTSNGNPPSAITETAVILQTLQYDYPAIIGRSPVMLEVLQLLDRITDSDASVLLIGESGTGKELMARAIHENGPRTKFPFIPVNCSAIPETLLEAELFGYERGAFTGAEQARDGVFATAQGGTLFLDEIGDMPLAMQAKLLRVLEDGVFKRLGSQAEMQVNVRIIAASNQDLKQLVGRKSFREDLFFRINTIRVTLPPLRERNGDLPLLAEHFLRRWAETTGKPIKSLSPAAIALLAAFSWPGNIRELENTLHNACLLAEGLTIRPEDLRQKEELFAPPALLHPAHDACSFDTALRGFQAELLQKTLDQCHGNISRTARTLQIPRPRLYRLIKKLHIFSDRTG